MTAVQAAPAVAPRRARWWDVLLTVLLLVGMAVIGVYGSFYGMLGLAFMDTCPEAGCNGDPIFLRWIGTAVLALAATTVSTVLLAVRRRAWWVAAIGLVGMFAIWSAFLVPAIAYPLR